MNDFATTLTGALQALAADIHAHSGGKDFYRKEAAHLRVHRRTAPRLVFHGFGDPRSSHERLAAEAFGARILNQTGRILDLVGAAIPALDTPNFGISISLEVRGEKGQPRMKFDLNGTRLSSNYIVIPTVAGRAARIQSLLAHIKEPGTRRFRVESSEIYAGDAADALAIYAALECPGILETEAETTPVISVSEITDTETLYSATLSRIREAA